jgi:hypothetical protein
MSTCPEVRYNVGPMLLPPRTPDLSTVNFLFWEFVRDHVCTSPFPQSLAELFGQLLVVTVAIETAVTQHVWEEIQHFLDHGCPTCSLRSTCDPPVCVMQCAATFVNFMCTVKTSQ